MSESYTFPGNFKADSSGRVVVSFSDIPEALTDGANHAEALIEARDCLAEALCCRVADGEDIPQPSSLMPGQVLVTVTLATG